MSRPLSVALLLSLFALAFAPTSLQASALQKGPPDSLDPHGPRGKVTFNHANQRTLACEAERKQSKLTCRPKLEAMGSATTLRVVPVRAPDLVGEDRRQPVTIQVPDDRPAGEVSQDIAPGIWEIEWAGRTKKERFRVSANSALKVQLTTVQGACVTERDACRLDATRLKRTVRLP